MTEYRRELPVSVETSAWTPEAAKEMGLRLEGSSPETILRWGFENFAPSIVMATGFGPEGIVLMHLVSEIRPETIVFYLDTDLLFSYKPFGTATNYGSVIPIRAATSARSSRSDSS
jgi:hypothetical protein